MPEFVPEHETEVAAMKLQLSRHAADAGVDLSADENGEIRAEIDEGLRGDHFGRSPQQQKVKSDRRELFFGENQAEVVIISPRFSPDNVDGISTLSDDGSPCATATKKKKRRAKVKSPSKKATSVFAESQNETELQVRVLSPMHEVQGHPRTRTQTQTSATSPGRMSLSASPITKERFDLPAARRPMRDKVTATNRGQEQRNVDDEDLLRPGPGDKWKLIIERNRSSGSGQVGCAKKSVEDLGFISVVEVDAGAARSVHGRCIHMREGAGIDRLDLCRLEPGHKMNRFVDMGPSIGNKCNLFKQLVRMRTLFPDLYTFFPPSWNFPDDLEHFQANAPKNKIYLLKPTVGSQGKGIRMASGAEVGPTYGKMCKELPTELESRDPGHTASGPQSAVPSPGAPKTGNRLPSVLTSPVGVKGASSPTAPAKASRHAQPNVCVQECIDPALINKSKFDLRIYVLMESVLPLRAHLCRSAMLRKCMEEYKPLHAGEKMSKFSLLTNTSINKKWKPEYLPGSDAGKGCKIPLHDAFDQLADEGIERESLWKQIEHIVALTLIAVHPRLDLQYRSCLTENDLRGGSNHTSKCFQMLGFDIMVDSSGFAQLLEVNTHPSFAWDTKIDSTIKRPAIAGCMAIVCGQNLPEVLPQIKEYQWGAPLSLYDKDGVLKAESERRRLEWLQQLYTPVPLSNHSSSSDASHAQLGADVLQVFLTLLRIEVRISVAWLCLLILFDARTHAQTCIHTWFNLYIFVPLYLCLNPAIFFAYVTIIMTTQQVKIRSRMAQDLQRTRFGETGAKLEETWGRELVRPKTTTRKRESSTSVPQSKKSLSPLGRRSDSGVDKSTSLSPQRGLRDVGGRGDGERIRIFAAESSGAAVSKSLSAATTIISMAAHAETDTSNVAAGVARASIDAVTGDGNQGIGGDENEAQEAPESTEQDTDVVLIKETNLGPVAVAILYKSLR